MLLILQFLVAVVAALVDKIFYMDLDTARRETPRTRHGNPEVGYPKSEPRNNAHGAEIEPMQAAAEAISAVGPK